MASLSSGTSTPLPSPPVSAVPVIHITLPVSTKLDRSNFLAWRSQIEPIIDGYGLAHHLDSSAPVPDEQIKVGEQFQTNPAFTSWRMQDRFLLGWLRSTISSSVLTQYVTYKTTASLWRSLHSVYSAISTARVMELRRLLQTTIRGGLGCNEYFEKMRGIADQLAAVGEPITDSDLARYVLNGLGSEFNSFIVALTTRSDQVSLADLHGYLLTHEALLLTQHQAPLPSSDPVALYASSGRGRGRNSQGRGRSSNSSQMGRGRGGPGRNSNGRGSLQMQGRGPATPFNSQNSEDKPICQICNKRGHSAIYCWYRSDFELYPTPEATPQFQAYLNTTTTSPSEGWFLDSGATHHVTSDINALSSYSPYVGHDGLQVGPPHYDTASTSTSK